MNVLRANRLGSVPEVNHTLVKSMVVQARGEGGVIAPKVAKT